MNKLNSLCWGAACSLFAQPNSLAAYPFVTHVQLRLPPEPGLPKVQAKKRIQEWMKAGYAVSLHAHPHINLSEPMEKPRQAFATCAREALQLASEAGALFTVFHAGYVQAPPTPENRQKGLTALCNSLEELAEFAPQLQLENIFPMPESCELIRLFDRPADYAYLQAAGFPTGFCLDTGHARLAGNGPEWLETAMVTALHLHENNGLADGHLPPAEGPWPGTPWLPFLQRLATRFTGPVIWETADLTAALRQTESWLSC